MHQIKRIAIVTTESADRRCARALSSKFAPLADDLRIVTIQSPPIDADLYIEAAGFERQDQLMALRCISAMANDESIVATSSPILSISEIASSVTNPERLVGIVPSFPYGRGAIEIVAGKSTAGSVITGVDELIRGTIFRSRPIHQTNGGPTLISRLFGHIAIDAWNLSTRTGDPAKIDRVCVTSGLPVGPLRIMDAIGVLNLATLLGRTDELSGVQRIYAASRGLEPHATFQSICLAADSSEQVEPGFAVQSVVRAAQNAWHDGITRSSTTILKAISAGLGVNLDQHPGWIERIREIPEFQRADSV